MTAALLLLLACPAAASEADPAAAAAFVRAHPDLGKRFAKEWRRLLEEVPELSEHRDWVLRQRKVELRFSDPGPGFEDSTIATWTPGLLRLNRRWLAWGGHELAARGVPYERVPALLAWKLLPVLAHELRHGMTQDEMRAEVGEVCPAFVIENEVLSFHDNVLVGKAALARNPAAFADELLLGSVDRDTAAVLSHYRSAPLGLFEMVRRTYKGRLSAITAPRENLLRDAEKSRQESAQLLADYLGGDAATKAAYRDSFGPDPERELRRALGVYDGCRRVFADPAKHERFRVFYRDRVDAVAEDWDP